MVCLVVVFTELALITPELFSLLLLSNCLADVSKSCRIVAVLHGKPLLVLFLHLLLHSTLVL